jgi:hypothetical protein
MVENREKEKLTNVENIYRSLYCLGSVVIIVSAAIESIQCLTQIVTYRSKEVLAQRTSSSTVTWSAQAVITSSDQ